MLSSEQIERVYAPGCESDGEGYVSNHPNLSIFTFTAPISLTVCLPWQRLFSDQLGVALASALFPLLCPLRLHSCLLPATQACTSGRDRDGKTSGWRERGERERREQKAKNIGEEKVFYPLWGKLLIRAEVVGQLGSIVYPTVVTVIPSVGKLLKWHKK